MEKEGGSETSTMVGFTSKEGQRRNKDSSPKKEGLKNLRCGREES